MDVYLTVQSERSFWQSGFVRDSHESAGASASLWFSLRVTRGTLISGPAANRDAPRWLSEFGSVLCCDSAGQSEWSHQHTQTHTHCENVRRDEGGTECWLTRMTNERNWHSGVSGADSLCDLVKRKTLAFVESTRGFSPLQHGERMAMVDPVAPARLLDVVYRCTE